MLSLNYYEVLANENSDGNRLKKRLLLASGSILSEAHREEPQGAHRLSRAEIPQHNCIYTYWQILNKSNPSIIALFVFVEPTTNSTN